MVAPQPLEPLVLYLAATPYFTSAALVAVREERRAKDTSRQAASSAGAAKDPEDSARAAATPARDRAQQDGAPGPAEAPTGDQALGASSPQGACQPPEAASLANAPALVEHPVYFVSTVLRDARERYLMPQKLLLALVVASRNPRHYFQGHPIKVVSAYPLERVLRSPTPPGESRSGTSSYRHSSWSSARPRSSRGLRSLTLWRNGRTPRSSKKARIDPSRQG
ncbi:unnamed protein product [Triticum aestivum]|uniref:Reverse transcriptase RNase H-like domain-containing protein n=1 Tax=Triticum aestivum TaxID=4565 RepID=A0A7H4LGR7_WHEAT|nr:unnamed protein product [Triticum aestivum]